MIDFFAVLQEQRRPWIDPDLLKQKFLSLSAACHPDHLLNGTELGKRVAQKQFTQLNAAYQCLREPRTRLQHLLELETGTKPQQVEQIPAALMNFFLEVGQAGREADLFLAQKSETNSPLLQVKSFEKSQEWTDKLMALQKRLSSYTDALLEQLKQLDSEWMNNMNKGFNQPANLIEKLSEVCRLLGYFNRWSSQIQERLVQLSL
jgi:DnaJ-domain-containing protein 1